NLYSAIFNAITGIFTNLFFGTASGTNLIATNATTTNATSTSLYASIFNAVTSTLTNLLFTNATGTNLTLTTASSSNLLATNATTTRLYVSGQTNLYGNVAIGTTTVPISQFDVTGTGNIGIAIRPYAGYSNINLYDYRADSTTSFGIYNGYPVAGDFTIRENTVADRLVIKKTTGYIGMGTSTPASALHVLSATSPQFRLGYDSTNYTNFSIGTDGALTITPTNSATTTIANGLAVQNNITVGGEASVDRIYDNQPLAYNGRRVIITSPYTTKANVYKGMMHDHTTNSDGAQTPTAVVTAYRDAGYDFISITDHDLITADPAVSGIVFMPGIETNLSGKHLNRINAGSVFSGTPQSVIDQSLAEGSFVFINHPNWPGGYPANPSWTDAELEAVDGEYGIEVWNSYITPNNNAESRIDYLLSKNRRVNLIANDDCHDVTAALCTTASTRVFADSATASEILEGLKRGNFYASNGANISSITVVDRKITISTDVASTIAFITDGGTVEQSTLNATSASYSVFGDEVYVRIRVTRDSDGLMAWSNPIYISAEGDLARGGVIRDNLYVNATTTIYDDLVVNTNSLVSKKATGYVGIGTAAPNNLLDLGTVYGVTSASANAKKFAVYNNVMSVLAPPLPTLPSPSTAKLSLSITPPPPPAKPRPSPMLPPRPSLRQLFLLPMPPLPISAFSI
ncbi:MAG: Phosphoesterase PHP domain protein, partial [Candidatus Wolfebacteria bacterium GW2011_GWA2_42_10]